MANQQGNGRNVAMPDENRPSWRPQDDNVSTRSRRTMSDDDDRDRMYRDRDRDDDRFMHRGGHWEDRHERRFDRDEGYRSTERYGQGQSGYAGGRYEDDRSMHFQSRNSGYPEGYDERFRDRGLDERWSGGGRGGYNPERYGAQGGYAGGRGFEYSGGHGHEGERMSTSTAYGTESSGYGFGRNERHYNQGGMQDRYGSQGYGGSQQGYGMGGPGHQGGMGYGSQQGWPQQGMQQGRGHRGKGPVGYMRSDERVREQICELLTDDDRIDASNIEITVKNGEVTLSGHVEDRHTKRLAEDLVENVLGVKDVQNQIRVGDRKASSGKETESATQDKRHRA